MFEKLISELKKMQKMQIPIPIDTDSEGYYDKECPSKSCKFQFKVYAEDWLEKFKDESVHCPLCGHNAPADTFWTTEQIEQGEEQAFKYLESKIDRALYDDAKDFNRRQSKNGFITIRMHYTGSQTNFYVMPIKAQNELQQKITCSKCSSRYAVLGSAYFCPCCGYNSVNETFDNSIRKIETKIKNLDVIRSAVSEIDKDEADVTVKSLIESCLSDGVVAFQRFAEFVYESLKKDTFNIKPNAFQNLEIGNEYWLKMFKESYKDWLSTAEYENLNKLFQQRHLLAHREGIVDAKYISKSGDNTYNIGQRIVVKELDILLLIELIQKLVFKIRKLSGNSTN